MTHVAITQLDLVEQQFNQVAAFLASGNAPQLQTASQALQALSVDLARLLQMPANASPASQKAIRQRVVAMAAGLQMLRDNLARQSAFTQQALQVLMPAQAKSTYGSGSSVYGSVARQSGVHKYLAA
jgi:flagellar biosynthesis/type III secretory pathway chaperone